MSKTSHVTLKSVSRQNQKTWEVSNQSKKYIAPFGKSMQKV